MDLAGREGSFSIVSNQFGGLRGDPLEGVIDKGVHDVHSLLADADLGVHLLQNLVDVERKGFYSPFGPLDDGSAASAAAYGFGCFPGGHGG